MTESRAPVYRIDAIDDGMLAIMAPPALSGPVEQALAQLSAMGFHQWPGDAQSSPLDERIPLTIPHGDDEVGLLTVCAASPDWVHAQRRAQQSGAVLEDMEAFSVAAACALMEVPLVVVRGVSNMAGDRDHTHWSITDAMTSVRERLEFLLQAEEAT